VTRNRTPLTGPLFIALAAVCVVTCSSPQPPNTTVAAQPPDSASDQSTRDLMRRAEAGDVFSQAYLGFRSFWGVGVQKDYVAAYMWIDLAAARASDKDRGSIELMRHDVAEKMTPQQVAEAQKRASEWMAGFLKRQK
jgi:TPR repeat protein